jgi:hypothetical protein
MPLTITLTDTQINEGRISETGSHQKVEQASDYLPVVVDLSTEITLGLAILTAIAADDLLWAEFGEKSEGDILASITSIAFVNPAEAISIKAYSAAPTHVRSIPISVVTYLPMVRMYRNYVEGGATAVTLDLGVAL